MSMDNYVNVYTHPVGVWFKDKPAYVVVEHWLSGGRMRLVAVTSDKRVAERIANSIPTEYWL